MPQVKTNNSHLGIKARLRADAVRAMGLDRVRVLDAFAGEGKVWQRVESILPTVTFDYLRIDKRKYDGPDTIKGDNLKVMPSLDLAGFDLIDLDAYGWPHEQLRLCAERAPDVPVAVTCIMTTRGRVPEPVLTTCGIPSEWLDYGKTSLMTFARWRQQWWDEYCARLGYSWTTKRMGTERMMIKTYQMLYTNRR